MTTYKDSGVDIEAGDQASKTAYDHAKSTFAARQGRMGAPVELDGGYSGLLDMGDYYLVQNDDGVGTKVMVAMAMNKYDTLGYDLLAMVCDDAICMGAETISMTNTIDTNKVDQAVTNELLKGLAKACQEQKIVIAGGEIAELSGLVNGFTWNASAIGMVEKEKVLTGAEIQVGDAIVGLQSAGFRSNGMSLVRKILTDAYGENWHQEPFEDSTWGEAVLTPSRIYSDFLLTLLGRYKEPSKVNIKGLSHITGGGLDNLKRILKKNQLGAQLNNLIRPHSAMRKLQELGNVSDEEAYKTWNMGCGMMVVSNEPEKIISEARQYGIPAQVIGVITDKVLLIERMA